MLAGNLGCEAPGGRCRLIVVVPDSSAVRVFAEVIREEAWLLAHYVNQVIVTKIDLFLATHAKERSMTVNQFSHNRPYTAYYRRKSARRGHLRRIDNSKVKRLYVAYKT